MLTTFIMPITILSTWSAVAKNVKEFHVFMLILETAMVGVFLATDLFLFYIFWELVLIPMYFLIGCGGASGGSTRRSSSSCTPSSARSDAGRDHRPLLPPSRRGRGLHMDLMSSTSSRSR